LFGGSNLYQSVDLSLQNFYWSGNPHAVVYNAEGAGLVKAIRITGNSSYAPGNGDPFQTLDLRMDAFNANDHIMWVMLESWGGIRFLNHPSLAPPELTSSVQLTFPPRPGFYSLATANTDLAYNFSGRKVIIDPSATLVTASGQMSAFQHSLNVSGGINTNTKFYCNNVAGLTTKVTYGTTNLYFSGGILIDKVPP